MKKGWLYRTSHDEKNHEIAHMMMTQWWSKSSYDPDPVMMSPRWSRSSDDSDPALMIQIELWSRSSNDDPVVIQIEWWSRSSDDDPMMIQIKYDPDLDEDDLKMKMMRTWWWPRWYREEDLCWKLCQENAFLVKRECWCICNFGMYSLVYFLLYSIVPQRRCLFLWLEESLI